MEKKADGTPLLDPTNNKPLLCMSCHAIHGSDFDALTLGDKKQDLCLRCHKAVMSGD
jgi:predicted CXXCH cytochrome family protein